MKRVARRKQRGRRGTQAGPRDGFAGAAVINMARTVTVQFRLPQAPETGYICPRRAIFTRDGSPTLNYFIILCLNAADDLKTKW